MDPRNTPSRAEAERLMGVCEKLLRNKDYSSCKDFALLAQEKEPSIEGSDQILAVADVLLASARKINNQHDWYAILQLGTRTDDPEQIKKQYRRLALLLHPDKNKFVFADAAFGLVADAWAILSNPTKKALFDNDLSLYQKVDLVQRRKPATRRQPVATEAARASEDQVPNPPVRKSSQEIGNSNNNENGNKGNEDDSNINTAVDNQSGGEKMNPGRVSGGKPPRPTFWSVCPYCYNLYEYARVYVGCCLRCENCKRAFTAAEILQMPPRVPGKNAYYCCWGFFPMMFVMGNADGKNSISTSDPAVNGIPNWMPPMFSAGSGGGGEGGAPAPAVADGGVAVAEVPTGDVNGEGLVAVGAAPMPKPSPTPLPVSGGLKRRGRPRKNLL